MKKRRRMTSTWINPPTDCGWSIITPVEIRHPVDDPPLRIKFGRKWYDAADLVTPVISRDALRALLDK